jgi:hypothetical protein
MMGQFRGWASVPDMRQTMLIPVLVEPVESHGYRAKSAPGLEFVAKGFTPDAAFGDHG